VTDGADTRRPGRPRSPEAHAAILRAAVELVAADGLHGLTIEAIAARAGVGKATIYRRWKTKEDLLADALRSVALTPDAPDTGSVRGDLEAAARAALGRLAGDAFRILPRLLAEAGDDPRLHAAVDEALLRPRRAAIGSILRRGVERGELRDDLDLDLVTDIVMAPIIVKVITSGGDLGDLARLAPRVFDTLAAGIGTGRRVG
jgi:AcrR family transcriptional regulator